MAEKNKTWTFYKGDWHEGDVRILGAASHSTWLGSLVFDGARYFEGVHPDLDLHSERVNNSARTLNLKPTLTGEEITQLALDGLKSKFGPDKDIYIRPMYWAEDYGAGMLPPDPESTDFALCLEEIPMVEPSGFSVTTTKFRRPTIDTMPTNAKAACLYANNARMILEARAKGFDNALTTDANGNVAELATANVFMAKGSEVFTPVATGSFLAGITRRRVLWLFKQAGITVNEVSLTYDDFREADEIFSTGNISKVVPANRFEDRELPYGPMAKKARELYWEWAHA